MQRPAARSPAQPDRGPTGTREGAPTERPGDPFEVAAYAPVRGHLFGMALARDLAAALSVHYPIDFLGVP